MRKRIAIIAVFAALVLISGCMGQVEHLIKQGQTPDMATCSDVIKDGQTDIKQLAGLFGSPTKVTTSGVYEERQYSKGNLIVTVQLSQDGIVKSHSCEIK